MVWNGSGLEITHTCSLSLPNSSHDLFLNNVLHVPHISRNLRSIGKFCIDDLVSVEFFTTVFEVKNLNTGAPLVTGYSKHGEYEWPSRDDPSFCFFFNKQSPSNLALSSWAPMSFNLKLIFLKFSFLILNKTSSPLCNACFVSKSHKVQFSVSSISSSKPLEVIFFDVWTSIALSNDGFKYYVIFVDHYTHYVWLYPLHRKSDVFDVFFISKSLSKTNFSITYSPSI